MKVRVVTHKIHPLSLTIHLTITLKQKDNWGRFAQQYFLLLSYKQLIHLHFFPLHKDFMWPVSLHFYLSKERNAYKLQLNQN